MNKKLLVGLLLTLFTFQIYAQDAFQLIVLGSGGGVDEHNISAYLLAPMDSDNFIALDAGTLFGGIKKAVNEDLFSPKVFEGNDKYTKAAFFLRSKLKAYILSHAHMDHISGLVMASPFDTPKNIYCTEQTKNAMLNGVFNGGVWANFSDTGENALGKYHFENTPENTWITISEPQLSIKAFPLSHSGAGRSTAFLIKSNEDYMLYFGDTGPDLIEGVSYIHSIWEEIVPLIQNNKLKTIFIECAFPNAVSDNKLYGHLTPKWLGEELKELALLVQKENAEDALLGMEIYVTHIKPSFLKGINDQEIIAKELEEFAYLGAKFIIAKQEQKYTF